MAFSSSSLVGNTCLSFASMTTSRVSVMRAVTIQISYTSRRAIPKYLFWVVLDDIVYNEVSSMDTSTKRRAIEER